MRRSPLRSLWIDKTGASAAEFALVLPAIVVLGVGAFHLCFMIYAAVSLHFAVEDAARCAAVKTDICSDGQAIQAYAESRYAGPRISPVFIPALDADCGESVSASGTYRLDVGLARLDVPLSARACFPAMSVAGT
jgi:Flp pilus assembly pilin Flp